MTIDHPDPAYALAASRLFLAADDVTAIEDLVRRYRVEHGRPPHVIDLGAGSGTTALAVFCADPLARVTTVDRDADPITWAERNIRPYFPTADWASLRSDAAAAAELWAGARVDLLLHDAGHEYEDVMRDLVAWRPRLRPGTYVWLHDYGPPPWGGEDYPGVRRACADLVAAGHYEQIGTPGMGWIGRVPTKGAS